MAQKKTIKTQSRRQTVSSTKSRAKKVSKKSTKLTDLTINHHRSRPIRRSTKRRIRRGFLRRRVVIILSICLLAISALIMIKVFIIDSETERTDQVNKVGPTKEIKTPPKSEIELERKKAEQNLEIVGEMLNNSSLSVDNVFKLKVPIYQQVYKQSCEAASLRMALAYRGIKTTDLAILELIKYNDQPAKKINGEWRWDNPHQTFVGDKDGDQTKMTGYGVFGEPIAAASEQLGRPTTLQNEVKPEWLALQIYAGNPVVLWGVSIKIADAHWKTADGLEITAPMRTHTRLVTGVKGDPLNPTGFYLNDPGIGMEIYWTTSQLNTNVAAGIGHSVAIY